MRVKTLLPAAVLALALTACAPAEPQTTPSPSPVPVPTESQVPEETAAPELVWTDQIFAKDFTADDGTVVMSVEYVFPDIENAGEVPAWQKIQDYYAAEGMAYMGDATELSG